MFMSRTMSTSNLSIMTTIVGEGQTYNHTVGGTFGGWGTGSNRMIECVVQDLKGNLIMSDSIGNCIWKVEPYPSYNEGYRDQAEHLATDIIRWAGPDNGAIGSTNGTGSTVRFQNPSGLAVDGNNNIYVCDTNNHEIRKIAPDGTVSLLAGSTTPGYVDAAGTSARFNKPAAAVASNNYIYIWDSGNYRIRRMSVFSPYSVTTVAGSGVAGSSDNATGTSASFAAGIGGTYSSGQLALDWVYENALYFADAGNHKIRKIVLSGSNTVTTLAGSGTAGGADGIGTAASFYQPSGICVQGDTPTFGTYGTAKNLYVTDRSGIIRSIDIPTANVTTIAGLYQDPVTNNPLNWSVVDDFGKLSRFKAPICITNNFYNRAGLSPTGYFIVDYLAYRIRKYDPKTKFIYSVACNQHLTLPSPTNPTVFGALDLTYVNKGAGKGCIFFATGSRVYKVTWDGGTNSGKPTLLCGGSSTGGTDGPFQGTGYGTFNNVYWMCVDDTGNNLYAVDEGKIRKLDLVNSQVTTIAGQATTGYLDNAVGTSAKFGAYSGYGGITHDATNNCLYMTDGINNRIRKISLGTNFPVSTIAGNGLSSSTDSTTGTGASFWMPCGIVYSKSANCLYVTENYGHNVRKISLAANFPVTWVAGGSASGYQDGWGLEYFANPMGLTVDERNGDIYVADYYNYTIRRIQIMQAGYNAKVSTVVHQYAQYASVGAPVLGWVDGPLMHPDSAVNPWNQSEYAKAGAGKARLYYPSGVAFDSASGTLYGVDTYRLFKLQ